MKSVLITYLASVRSFVLSIFVFSFIVANAQASSLYTTDRYGVLSLSDVTVTSAFESGFLDAGRRVNVAGEEYIFLSISSNTSGVIRVEQPVINNFKLIEVIELAKDSGNFAQNTDSFPSTVTEVVVPNEINFSMAESQIYLDTTTSIALAVFKKLASNNNEYSDEYKLTSFPDNNFSCRNTPCGVPNISKGLASWSRAYYKEKVESELTLLGSLVTNQIKIAANNTLDSYDNISTASQIISIASWSTNTYSSNSAYARVIEDTQEIGFIAAQLATDQIDALAVDTLESQANAKALETFLGGVESAASFYLAAKSGDIRGATLTFANSFSSSLATGAVAVTNIYTTNQLAKRINNIILAKKLLYLRYFGEYAEPEIYQQYGLDIAVNNFDDLLSELSVNESLFPVGSICPSSDAPDLPRATYFVAFGITGYVLCSVSEAIVIDYDAAQVESIFNRYETNFENWAFARATANQSIYIDIDNDGIANKLDSHPNNSELPVQIVNLEPVAVITPSSRSVELNTEVYLDGESSYDPNEGQTLNFEWSVRGPGGESITIASPTSTTISFTPNKVGTYSVYLKVFDDEYSDTKSTSIEVNTVYPDLEVVYYNDKAKIYIEDVTFGADECQIMYLPSVTVPSDQKWKSITFAASKGDVVLLVDDDETPTLKGSRGCPNYTQDFDADAVYDWGPESSFFNWNSELAPGDTLRFAVFSYEGDVRNYGINSEVTVTTDLDGDGVPDENEDEVCRDDPTAKFDSDGDTVCDSYDAFPNDLAASVDSDGDGYPDSWNPGMSQNNSTSGLVLDHPNFVNNETEWSDLDNDSVGDNADRFPNDSAASVDSDNDGFPDSWNIDKAQDDSATGLVLDKFQSDPAAALDSDDDGYPDKWNTGRGAEDSTTGLILDRFINNENEWADSDGDNVGDNSDWAPNDINEWIDTDEDGVGDNADAAPNDPSRSSNVSPVIGEIQQPTLTAGEETVLTLSVGDSDGDVVTIEIFGVESFAVLSGNEIRFEPTEAEVGEHHLIVRAADSYDGTHTKDVFLSVELGVVDSDGDGVLDSDDNCPSVFNPGQENTDGAQDGGDACDEDDDNDSILDIDDVYPLVSVLGFTDTDNDGAPDECNEDCLATGMASDEDDDNDGILDIDDAFPLISLDGFDDNDRDGIPDECSARCTELGMTEDLDDDNDGLTDLEELNYLLNPLSPDTDADGILDPDELFDIIGSWKMAISFGSCDGLIDEATVEASDANGTLKIEASTENELYTDCTFKGPASVTLMTGYSSAAFSDLQFLALASSYSNSVFEQFEWVDDERFEIEGFHNNGVSVKATVTRIFTGNNVENDLNRDGKSDILWRSFNKGWNFLWAMDGTQISEATPINVVQEYTWTMDGLGDYDGDGKSDIFWRNSDTGKNFIYLMDGADIKDRYVLNYVTAGTWQLVGNGDFNADGVGDVMWRNVERGDTWFYLMENGRIGESKPSLWVTDLNFHVVATGDIDGDGDEDIIWRRSTTGLVYIWLMEEGEISSQYSLITANTNWQIAGTGDIDGDGTADIILRNQADGRNWVYLMKDGQIDTSTLINEVADLNWQIGNIGDYDGDGKADLMWRNEVTTRNIVHLMDGTTVKSRGVLRPTDNTWQVAK